MFCIDTNQSSESRDRIVSKRVGFANSTRLRIGDGVNATQ